MNFYKKCTAKPFSFLVTDTTLSFDNPLRFPRNLLRRIWKPIKTIDDKIRDENLLYSITREAAKTSALASEKNDIYEYLMCGEILPSNERKLIKQAKFVYSPLELFIEKQTKTIKYQGEKQIDAITNQIKSSGFNQHNHKDNYRKYLNNYFIKDLTK